MSRVPDLDILLDLTQDKVAVIGADGIYRHLNATVADLLGFEPDELVDSDAFALVHPDDELRIRTAFDAIVDGDRDTEAPLEYRYGTADGNWVWLRTQVYTPAETDLDGYAMSSRDVTAEVETRRRLETIAAASSDVFWMYSADWSELLFINDAIEDVFGITRSALKRDPTMFVESIHSDDRAYVERAMERLSAGESILIDYRVKTEQGTTKWLRVPAEPVIEDGRVVAVTGFSRDVTDEYRRERQLTVMDNLLRHTIRNDMNVVDGTAERITDRVAAAVDDSASEQGDGLPSDALDALAADLHEQTETIRRVADDLLTTAEKQRGVIELLRQRGAPEPVEITPLVESAVEIAIEGKATADDVLVCCPDGLRAFTHAELDYAIAELIENAVEHAESTPSVHVVVETDGDAVDIAVRDNCPPIPTEERHVITDRWEMDDLHHTDGMGLWLVYWIADRSGGNVTFGTHADGNVVTLSVPSADCDQSETESSRAAVVDSRQTGLRKGERAGTD
ncbi:PAS domain-containing sensor histidine kinase [Halorubrum sp. DTA46]|uniref:PAS domain-containing sensor histidine kinase n=1 Tax=Halorubrum sp. DTA46 TaxID=3402162 RepID=UPI003AAFD898